MEFEKHTGIFSTSGDVASALSTGAINKPYIAIVQDGNYLDWNTQEHSNDYSKMYFTIDVLSAGTINFQTEDVGYADHDVVLDYSFDGENWTTFTSLTSTTEIQVATGDKVMFRGNNLGLAYNGFNSGSTSAFKAYGNVMSLFYGDGFSAATTFPKRKYGVNSNCLASLFGGCTALTDASNLVLPVLDLSEFSGAYSYMFSGCSSLIAAPELPATTLSHNCYGSMLRDCTSLTTAPRELPATTLSGECYNYMFAGCTSLTTAPDLPAPVAVSSSNAHYMFSGCSSLNYVKCLGRPHYRFGITGWLAGVASSGTFVKDPNSTWPTGANGIPEGWTVVDYTP